MLINSQFNTHDIWYFNLNFSLGLSQVLFPIEAFFFFTNKSPSAHDPIWYSHYSRVVFLFVLNCRCCAMRKIVSSNCRNFLNFHIFSMQKNFLLFVEFKNLYFPPEKLNWSNCIARRKIKKICCKRKLNIQDVDFTFFFTLQWF
jgi:hypothetical protein